MSLSALSETGLKISMKNICLEHSNRNVKEKENLHVSIHLSIRISKKISEKLFFNYFVSTFQDVSYVSNLCKYTKVFSSNTIKLNCSATINMEILIK